jgi:L-malate glycosyltransferase
MQRLLFMTERFAPDLGGVARSATRLVNTLTQLDIGVDVVTWSRFLQPGEVLPPENQLTPVYRIGLYRHWDMTMPHTLNLLDWLHDKQNYDAVWGHYLFPSGFLATWFARLKGLPSTVSARGNDIDKEMFPPGDFARLQWTLKNTTLITAVSRDMGKKIELLSGRDDVLVLKNVVNEEVFCPTLTGREKITRESLGIQPDEVVLGFCGELREKKGQQFLLNAFTKVRSEYSACLLIIGEVRVSQESILQLYKNQYPENALRVIVTGHLDMEDVAACLRLCDVYLQPSLWEGMPNALLEAMACGCCCIGSDAGGIPEVIVHGDNGFLITRSHLHKLGDAALDILGMLQTEKTRISQAARQHVLKYHSMSQEKELIQVVMNRLFANF